MFNFDSFFPILHIQYQMERVNQRFFDLVNSFVGWVNWFPRYCKELQNEGTLSRKIHDCSNYFTKLELFFR